MAKSFEIGMLHGSFAKKSDAQTRWRKLKRQGKKPFIKVKTVPVGPKTGKRRRRARRYFVFTA